MTELHDPLIDLMIDKGIVGKDNAVRRSVLAALLAVTVRNLREMCESARLSGHFIGYSSSADDGGIYLASTDEEREEMFQKIRGECIRRLRQYSALKRSMVDRNQSRLSLDAPGSAV